MNAITDQVSLPDTSCSVAAAWPHSGKARGVELLYQLHEHLFGDVATHMVELGWSIYPQTQDRRPGKVHGTTINWKRDHDLVNRRPTPEALQEWCRFCSTDNVALVSGPASGDIFAVDIDVMDATMSRRIIEIADDILGYTSFRRVGQAPKLVLLYRQTGAERVASVSRRLDIEDEPGKRRHAVEILGDGKSITIHGRHHKTGHYFKWLDVTQSPLILGPEAAPKITAEQVRVFLQAVNSRFPFYDPSPVAYGAAGHIEVDGLLLPRNSKPEILHDASGRVVDGRWAWMGQVAWHAVLTRREEVVADPETMRQTLLAATIAGFRVTAECRGRWAAENLASEARSALEGSIKAALNGTMTGGRKQPPVTIDADKPDALETERSEWAERKLKRARLHQGALISTAEAIKEKMALVLDGHKKAQATTENDDNVGSKPAHMDEVPQPCAPYVPLGFSKGRYHFISRSGEHREFSEADLGSTSKIITLDSYDNWLMRYPQAKGGLHNARVAEHLMLECEQVGMFSPRRVRGRGLWYDAGRTVLHLGDRLVVDGVETRIRNFTTKNVYSLAETMELQVGKPLTDAEGGQIVAMCEEIAWAGDRRSVGKLFAGWLLCAAVCGGLDWRPHGYVAGEKGSGKGWLLANVVRPILGDQALAVKSKTSEASIRRDLGSDARPVIFDEFESQNLEDRKAKQQVLDLARAASEEDGTEILKASTEGDGVKRFKIRSSFLFLSINLGLSQAADQSRVIVFQVRQPSNKQEKHAAFERCLRLHREVMSDDIAARFLGRALQVLPELRRAARVFKRTLVRAGREERTGDTWGSAIAGAWCLTHSGSPSSEQAEAFVSENGWAQATEEAEVVPEWRRALDLLLQQRILVAGSSRVGADLQVGEAVAQLAGYGTHELACPEQDLRRSLGEFGIRVDGHRSSTTVTIANKSSEIDRVFERTYWAGSAWRNTVSNAEGAMRTAPAKFGALTSRGVAMSFSTFIDD